MSVALLNQALRNTGSNHRVDLKYFEASPYDLDDVELPTLYEGGTTRERLKNHGDGYFDHITEPVTGVRDQLGIDLAIAVSKRTTGPIGAALSKFRPHTSGNPDTHWTAWVGPQKANQPQSWSLLHEFGHLVGLCHSISSSSGLTCVSSTPPQDPDGHGERGYTEPTGAFKTLLGHLASNRILQFSNHNGSYGGLATGVSDATDLSPSMPSRKDYASSLIELTMPVVGGIEVSIPGVAAWRGGTPSAPGSAADLTAASPAVLSTPSDTLTWTTGTATPYQYWVQVGTTPWGNDLYDAPEPNTSTSVALSGLPTGQPIYVSLWTMILPGTWAVDRQRYNHQDVMVDCATESAEVMLGFEAWATETCDASICWPGGGPGRIQCELLSGTSSPSAAPVLIVSTPADTYEWIFAAEDDAGNRSCCLMNTVNYAVSQLDLGGSHKPDEIDLGARPGTPGDLQAHDGFLAVTVAGRQGADRIWGSHSAANLGVTVFGHKHNDEIYATDSWSVLVGGDGSDLIEGGLGADVLVEFDDGVTDVLFGGPGHDQICTEDGSDVLIGNDDPTDAGYDVLYVSSTSAGYPVALSQCAWGWTTVPCACGNDTWGTAWANGCVGPARTQAPPVCQAFIAD